MIKALLVIALMGQPVAAQCLAEGQVPRTIDFGNDQVVRNIIVKDGVVT